MGCFRVVTHPGTMANPAHRCLTSVIWREPVCHRRLAVDRCHSVSLLSIAKVCIQQLGFGDDESSVLSFFVGVMNTSWYRKIKREDVERCFVYLASVKNVASIWCTGYPEIAEIALYFQVGNSQYSFGMFLCIWGQRLSRSVGVVIGVFVFVKVESPECRRIAVG